MKPILKYPGAKWRLAEWTARYLPQTPHYVEPFCGSAAIYLNLPWRPRHAVLNDLNGDIVNLFRVLRSDAAALVAAIELTPWSREEFAAAYESTDDPVERARRFLVRSHQGHTNGTQQGKGRGSNWRSGGITGQRANGGHKDYPGEWRALPEKLLATVERLRDAEIDNDTAIRVIARHASSNVLLYVDPPYVESTRSLMTYYSHEMTDADHGALLDALRAHPGPVALAGYPSALYDDALPGWRRVETAGAAEKNVERTECLWLNPVLQERLSYGPLFDYAA